MNAIAVGLRETFRKLRQHKNRQGHSGWPAAVLAWRCLWMSSPLFAASLFHISRFDPLTLSLTPALLLGVALFAAYWPARRAVRVDPKVALRYE